MNRAVLLALPILPFVSGCAAPGAGVDPGPVDEFPHTTPLDWTLGEWTGVRRSANDGAEEPIRVRVTPLLGGAGNLREMWVEHDGGVYRGMSIQLRDAESGLWTRSYANDVRGRLVTLTARGPVGGVVDVWRSDPNAEGRASENRSERVDDDGWRSTVLRTTDGGATWSDVFVDELRRVAP